MGRWTLAIIVSSLVSWYPASLDSVRPDNQAESSVRIDTPRISLGEISADDASLIIRYGSSSIQDQCTVQPTVIWCNGYSEFVQPLTRETIESTDARVRANFTYTSDPVDTWRVHTKSVIRLQPWLGDCDDLSSTVLDLLARTGQPLDRMWLLLVASQVSHKMSGKLDHLIAMVEDDQGKFWIVGDTNGESYDLSELNHRVLAFMSLNDLVWVNAEKDKRFAEQFGTPSWLDKKLDGLRDAQSGSLEGSGADFPDEVTASVKDR